MDVFEFYKKEVDLGMFLNTIVSWLSLLKQKLYCNVENIVYVKDDDGIPDIYPKIKVEYEIISNTDKLDKYFTGEKIKDNIVKFRYFIKHGCKMYLAFYNKKIVGYCFVCKLNDFKPYLYLNHPLFEEDNKYYIFFCHTFNEYQRKGIYSYILTQICKNIIKKDEKVFISTSTKNIASQKGIGKVGFKKMGVLKYRVIYGFRGAL